MADEAKAKGNAAFSSGNYSDAIRHFTDAINLAPDNHVLYSNRSAAYASLNQFKEALNDAVKTVDLKPDWAKGYSRIGSAHHGLLQFNEAVSAYKKGLEIDPSNEALKSGLAEAESAQKSSARRGSAGPGSAGAGNLFGHFGDAFGPDMWAKLTANPATRLFMSQPDFVSMMKDLQRNPSNLNLYLKDQRVMQALNVLLNVKFQGGPGGDDVEMGEEGETSRESNERKRPAEDEKKREPEPEPEPEPMEVNEEEREVKERKENAKKEKENGNAAYKKLYRKEIVFGVDSGSKLSKARLNIPDCIKTMAETKAECSGPFFLLNMLVAKKENKVIMAETSKELIEVLFSLMTMPIARVVSLTRNCTPGDIGCVSNLYKSVEVLDKRYLQGYEFLNILFNPRSAAEIYCENLNLNLIDNDDSHEYYVCDDMECHAISYYNIGTCRCGEKLKYKTSIGPSSKINPDEKEGILKSTARFMITDDFKVMPVAMADMNLLNEFEKHGKIEEKTIIIGREEVLKLLECSLRSRTPLSETFLNQSNEKSSNELLDMNEVLVRVNSTHKLYDLWKKRTDIRLKIIFDKVNNIALYAVVNEDFVNLLSTFLTFPLGYIFNHFTCNSFNGCLGNLNKSILETDINLFTCNKKKDALVNPKLPPGLTYNSYLVGIQEATILSECTPLFRALSAKKQMLRFDTDRPAKVFGGFIKGPATFLVMDDLEVKPFSPISVKLLVDKLMVPLSDLVEQEVILDEDKAMHLLAASLASKHALTATFLRKDTNVHCFDFLRNLLEGKGNGFKAC